VFMAYTFYSGLRELLDAIRPNLEAHGYKIVVAETPEAEEAHADCTAYVVIDYTGVDFATVTVVPDLNPKTITVPRNANGSIPGYLASELIRSYIESESPAYVAELEARAAALRDPGRNE
jgi:hypothetical protein